MKQQEKALHYAAMGWPVFPCDGKLPYTEHGHLDATTDTDQIKRWWSQWPTANVGYAVPGNIVVLDVDVKHHEGKFGDETLADYEAEHGKLPPTVEAITQSGGRHLYFKTDKPVPCRNGFLPSLDCKSKGGYVILYEWEASSDPADVEMAVLPEPLYQLMTAQQRTEAKELPEVIPEGQRNDTMFRLGSMMRGKGLTGAAIQAALWQENLARCKPPLDEREIRTIAASCSKYERGELPAVSGNEWEPPIPFDTFGTMSHGSFPIESLPFEVAAFVEALADSTQTPVEMAAILSIGVLAAIFQGRYTVRLNSDWTEQLSVYTVAVAAPGERKSAVIAALTKVLYDYEAERALTESEEVMTNQAERRVLEKSLAEAETKAAKGKGSREDVRELAAELAGFKGMYPYRMLADDTTPEKLVNLMAQQGGKIAVASAEGGVFDAMAGRYDKTPNIDIYLKGHAGDSYRVDRIGRPSEFIPHPCLTMILTVQPDVLNGLMANSTFKGRGLCARFLYVICNSKVGHRDVNSAPVPEDIRTRYHKFMRGLLSMPGDGEIRLSDEAQAARISYAQTVETRLAREWDSMVDWGSKAVGAMLRIAGLIHAAEQVDPVTMPMSAETVEAAVKVTEYLSYHASDAYQAMGADPTIEDAKYVLRRVREAGKTELSKRDLYRLCHGHFATAESMEPALTVLEEHSYIRIVEIKTGGRPTKKLVRNPCDTVSKVPEAP